MLICIFHLPIHFLFSLLTSLFFLFIFLCRITLCRSTTVRSLPLLPLSVHPLHSSPLPILFPMFPRYISSSFTFSASRVFIFLSLSLPSLTHYLFSPFSFISFTLHRLVCSHASCFISSLHASFIPSPHCCMIPLPIFCCSSASFSTVILFQPLIHYSI